MGENGLTASDVALMSRDGDGFGNGWGGMIWLFAILAMMGGGGFGGWGNGNNNTNAIQADVNRGFDNQNLQAQTRDILAAVTTGTAQSVAATNQTFHDTLGIIQNRYDELARDISGLAVGQANLLANQNNCCCETRMQLQQNNYDAAMRDNATNLAIITGNQKILDALAENKIEAMQNRINQLELQNALQGVVRYPNGFTYNAGASPFCGCSCNM